MCESRFNNEFMDMGHPFSDMGIYYTLVFIYFYIQVIFPPPPRMLSLYTIISMILIRSDSTYFYYYSNFWPVLNVGAVMLGNDKMLFSSPVFWLGLILIPTAVLLLDVTVKT